MPSLEQQLRIHIPVEFGTSVLPPTLRRHVTYGLGTGLELRWSQPRELESRIAEARWSAMLATTYNHDCSSTAWELWAVGSLCLLSATTKRTHEWAAIDAMLRRARVPHGYAKFKHIVTNGLTHARAAKFEGAPRPNDCAGIGAAALALVIVNHVNLSGSPTDRQVVEQMDWLRALSDAVGRKSIVAELEQHWRSGALQERPAIQRSLERLSSRA